MSAPSDRTPPLTNRGCLTPDTPPESTETGVIFHPDYLKVSLFGDIDDVFNQVRDQLILRAGLDFKEWANHGSAMFWDGIYEGPGPVHVLVPKQFTEPYAVVEIKGQGCAAFGPELLHGFMRYIVDSGRRWNGLRFDLAFDHVAFTPHMVDEAIRRGDIKSRCLGVEDRDWNDNELGQTAYLGGRGFKGPRKLRVYNKRGFNRCEAEFRKEWASTAIIELAKATLDQWPTVAVGLLCGMVNFVDRSANQRLDRCPLLPWWSQFVGNAEAIKNISDAARRKSQEEWEASDLGKAQKRLDRLARTLWPIIDAWGGDYVIERLLKNAEDKITVNDQLFRESLYRMRHSGLCGLPDHEPGGDNLPF